MRLYRATLLAIAALLDLDRDLPWQASRVQIKAIETCLDLKAQTDFSPDTPIIAPLLVALAAFFVVRTIRSRRS